MEKIYQFLISLVIIVVASPLINWYIDRNEAKKFEEVKIWLAKHNFKKYADEFQKAGYTSLIKVGNLTKDDIENVVSSSWSFLQSQSSKVDDIFKSTQELKLNLQFEYWLHVNRLKDFKNTFKKMNIYTLKQVLENTEQLKKIKKLSDSGVFSTLRHNDIDGYPLGERESVSWFYLHFYWTWTWSVTAAVAAFIRRIFTHTGGGQGTRRTATTTAATTTINWFMNLGDLFRRSQPINIRRNRDESNDIGMLSSLFGTYFDAKKSTITWNMADEVAVVGNEVVMTVQFFRHNGLQFPASELESLKCEVLNEVTMIQCHINNKEDKNTVTIHFTPIKAGQYNISILANGSHAGKSPYKKVFKAACIDAQKSSLHLPSSLLVLQQCVQELIMFDERDKYGNICLSKVEELYKYQFSITEMKENGQKISPMLSFISNDANANNRNKAWLTISQPGVYLANVFYDNEILSDNIVLLVLTTSEFHEVLKNTDTPSWSLWYEAYTKQDQDGSKNNGRQNSVSSQLGDAKRKKVYCFINSKLLTIKEYYWKIFPKNLYTFRIKPSLKISLADDTCDGTELKGFRIETNCEKNVELFSRKRNVLVATLVKFLLKNIGGSECFENKKSYFYKELHDLHTVKSQMSVAIKVKRQSVLHDTFRAVKSFSRGDWWKKLNISFVGELGLDYGGLTREWIHVLIGELFHADGALFRRFNKDDQQALIHPNPFRKEKYQKIKFFELAGQIVGKCLVECSCGQVRQQYVKARFTRSFLSQLLGLGVSWRHFETDDKEYYSGKIKYIIENDPQYLDLTFTEDVYDNDNKLVKTVDLKHNGSKIEVTESNKMEYIQQLAEYRLYESVKEEITLFLKGLNSIVPEGLLSIFDENELELLICGMDGISVADLKANCVQAGSSRQFHIVCEWFWTVISSFNQEELARLLQFTTGCSQLPPNGFAGLVPTFQITSAGGTDTLPTAHTCFNNLCLPHYSSMEELWKKLLLAITEGSEGFGMM
ncbi:apoptosis-resistant E3 ubiquitin protein ligase 1-like isoform X2 [Hydractinia symbiolongicarpus]|uniref:apoptosis-resistant E3 ubiquitin protein ligase 1-like isoform X2 n=1 Tax=Hydractinia symbiolongicarpus TaxID=13093 RepID=UPI00254BC563|nr:apoptosis-resistant E3 ubiquitin protein ligase 1-like isoform X2 [Hydractinia symbiolongicarpus]